MIKNTGENKKTRFFYLVLTDLVIAIQVATISGFLSDGAVWANKSFLLSFLLSLVIFLFSSGVLENVKSGMKIARLGFLFLIAGNLFGFFAPNHDMFIFSRIISGLGFGILVTSQIGIIWHSDLKTARNLSVSLAIVFLAGIIFGGKIIETLSGPALGELKVSLIFGAVIPTLAIFESSEWITKIGLFLKKQKNRIGILGLGHTVNFLTAYPFDFILYPYVIWKLGIIKGGILMGILSAIICYLFLLFYDWSKKDWLGIETIKGLREYKGKSLWGKFSAWMMQKSDPVVFLFLSIYTDPFITITYMRKGVGAFSGLSRRDWKIFILSIVVVNVYWTIVAYLGVSVIEYIWKIFA